VHLPGTKPADYLRELLRNPDILAKNIEQASAFNFGGMARGVNRPLSAWANPEKASRLTQMRSEGKSFADIADELGISREAVAGRVWRQNNPRQRTSGDVAEPPFWTDKTDTQLTKLLGQGWSYNEAARTMGTSRGAIAGRARVLGLQSQNTPFGYRASQERTPSLPQLKSMQLPEDIDPAELARFLKIFGDK